MVSRLGQGLSGAAGQGKEGSKASEGDGTGVALPGIRLTTGLDMGKAKTLRTV